MSRHGDAWYKGQRQKKPFSKKIEELLGHGTYQPRAPAHGRFVSQGHNAKMERPCETAAMRSKTVVYTERW